MTIIKTTQVLNNHKGESLKNGDTDMTVGDAMSNILSGKVSNPTKGWVLGKKFATEDTVELLAEDVVFLKKEVESTEMYVAVVTGQLAEILEATENRKEVANK